MSKSTVQQNDQRPDPDALLRQIQSEEQMDFGGRLKIFLGYSSGVGKSFRMLDEARRRSERGQDVVIGAIQPNVPDDVAAILAKLEVIPLLYVDGIPVLDVATIVARRPDVCIIDGLAYDNPSGSRHPKRWQDVEDILRASISVITSLNLQYVDEQREAVEKITGKRVSQTVPESFIKQADEIVIVDAPPEACQRGSLTEGQLSELRERALVLTADVIDQKVDIATRAQERILVCLTPRTSANKMLASAKRTASRFHGVMYAAYVTQPEITPEDREALERNLNAARAEGAKVEVLDGDDPVEAILSFAQSAGITQIFIGHTQRRGWLNKLTSTPVDRLLAKADGFDVRVFPQ